MCVHELSLNIVIKTYFLRKLSVVVIFTFLRRYRKETIGFAKEVFFSVYRHFY